MPRLPRFERVHSLSPVSLTERDEQILRLLERHRFLRSTQIVALLGGSLQSVLRRLQLLYHQGYVERPRAQLDYYHKGGSRPIVYGLGNKAGKLLKHTISWGEKNRATGRIFLEHGLLVSDIMVSLELACRKQPSVRLLYEEQLALEIKKRPCQWYVKLAGIAKLGIVPDRVFALEYADLKGELQRAHFFLEADRGTMPVIRKNLVQTSFYRKLLAYEATWVQRIHQRVLGINRFRVLTVTSGEPRVKSLLDACSKLERGHGLFLFIDQTKFKSHPDPLRLEWLVGRAGETSTLLNEQKRPGS